jgi:hypothetical protein
MVITYRQKFLFAKALVGLIHVSEEAVPLRWNTEQGCGGTLSRLRVRPFLNIGPICWPINVTPNKKLPIDYYLSSGRRYVGQGRIGQIALCEAEAVVGPASSRSSARALSLLGEIIFRHLFRICRIGIHLPHLLVDRFGLVSRIKL